MVMYRGYEDLTLNSIVKVVCELKTIFENVVMKVENGGDLTLICKQLKSCK